VATGPAGHASATDDYCDTCGLVIAAPAAPPPGPRSAPPPAGPAGGDTCAACGAERGGRFCEECGHDAALPPPPQFTTGGGGAPAGSDFPGTSLPDSAPLPGHRLTHPPTGSGPAHRRAETWSPAQAAATWTAVVRADRAWFDEVRRREGPDAAAVEFPPYCPERRFVLTGAQVAIGRRSRSRGTNPEIDLSGPPLDPGVSAQHALLLARPDGGWDVVDLDSTNGTSVGAESEPIAAHTPVPLVDGDRIRLGAWTTITVEREGV
jgi:hypothetical protein